MARRTNRITVDEKWRERIAAGKILERLIKHVRGELEMTSTQVNAAKTLLAKIYPDLKATDHSGELSLKVSQIEVVRKKIDES